MLIIISGQVLGSLAEDGFKDLDIRLNKIELRYLLFFNSKY